MGLRHVIYGLTDPRTFELRYVGRSSSGLRRARGHSTPTSLRLHDHCHRWIRELVEHGLRPIAAVVESCPDGHPDPNSWLNERERYWIALKRAEGCPLTNISDGGAGLSGRKWSVEQTETMRRKMTGRKFSKEIRARMSESHKGKRPPLSSAFGKEYPGRRTICCKPIRCVEDSKMFPSLKSAAEFYGTYSSNVCKVLRGIRERANGHVFEYVKEKDDNHGTPG
mgnify:CR=1 FL=1